MKKILLDSRLTNLIAMRADGEISKDEYQAMRSPVDEEIKKLQKALDDIPQEKSSPKGLDLEGIRSTLNSLVDFSGSTISHDVVNQFVYLITPTSDTTFDWYVNLNGTADGKATFTAEGRRKNCIIKLEEIEKISSVRVQRLCKGNRIEGILNVNRVWLIPKSSKKPVDKRRKVTNYEK